MNKLLHTFWKLGYVDTSNDEIIAYGLQRIHDLLIDIIGVIICGILMGNVWASLVFEVVYILLRIYAGGYHASSEKKCKYLSWGSIVLSLALVSYMPFSMNFQHFLMLLSMISILYLSPVESSTKPLTGKEKKVFRYRSIVIAVGEGIMYTSAVYFNGAIYAKAICIAMTLVAIGLIGGKDYKECFKKAT